MDKMNGTHTVEDTNTGLRFSFFDYIWTRKKLGKETKEQIRKEIRRAAKKIRAKV